MSGVELIASDPRGLVHVAIVGLAAGLVVWAFVDFVITRIPTWTDYLEPGGALALLGEARAVGASVMVLGLASWGLSGWLSHGRPAPEASRVVVVEPDFGPIVVELAPEGGTR